jgi:hypothetical protein
MHAPFVIAAALRFDEADPDAFEMDAYDGGLLRVAGYDAPVVVDLAGLREAPQVKACYEHKQVVGHQESVAITSSGIKTRGRLSVDTEETRTIRAAQKGGFKWDASVLVVPDQGSVDPVPRGQTVRVNNRPVLGPAYIARRGELREVSFVGVGGGSNTRAVVMAASLPSEGIAMSEKADQPAETTPAQKVEDHKPVIAALEATTKQQAAEIDRLTRESRGNQFNQIVARYKVASLPQPIVAKLDTKADSLRQEFIDGKVTADKVELDIIKASQPEPGTFQPWSGPIHSKPNDLNPAAIEASLLRSNGWGETELAKHFKPNDIEAALGVDYRYATIGSVMDALIGQRKLALNDRKSNDFIRAGLRADADIRASGFSTVSLSGILGNVANKEMLRGYTAVETTWSRFCKVRSVNDFKAHTAYRMDFKGAYKKIGPDGEIKHATLGEGSVSLQADTYGTMIALTRQMIINDDLNAFSELPAQLGRAAAIRLEEAVYVLLLANAGSFFATGNGNYFEGAATNLQMSSLTTAEQMFLNFVDSNNKPVLVSPKLLLVGTALKATAEDLYKGATLVGGSSTVINRNPHEGKYTVVVSPYMNNTSIKDQDGAAISGQSATKWLLLAEASDRAVVHVGFLRGNQTPTIESADTDFNTLGMQWRSYHDFGVAQGETTGGVMSKGAA